MFTGEPVDDRSFFAGSLGAGARMQVSRALSVGIDARWHSSLGATPASYLDADRGLSVVTLNAGATLQW